MSTEKPVPDEAVAAALAAIPEYQRRAREIAWAYPSQGQVRAMLEAAAPLLAAPRLTDAECGRLHDMVTGHAEAVRAVRKALDFAAMWTRTEDQGGIVAAARAALKVLEGSEETGDGR